MYGQNEIKILYRDALAHTEDVQEGTYSVLIANPPYSVKGFLETLSEEDRESYELYNSELNIDTNNSIETFFVERAKQLLKKDGIAAIILPSSVLSNGNIYIKCREIILKYFDLVAIFESGSGTFGKTGTNTATLFMRRREDTPSLAEQYQNRVDSWFGGNFDYDKVYEDFDKVEKYCSMQNYPLEDYKKFLAGELTEKLLKNEIFAEYKKTFENDTNAKNILKKKITPKYTEENKKADFEKYVFEQIKQIEKDKLCYYMLSVTNQDVLVIKSPNDNKEIKKFLGYEWSASKGNEGIKYLGSVVEDEENQLQKNKGIEGIQTPLFNPKDFDDETKLNYFVRQNFMNFGEDITIPQNLQPFASLVPLYEMIDFSRTGFDKAIKTKLKVDNGELKIQSKYQLVKLGEVAEINYGTRITKKDSKGDEYPVYGGGGETFRYEKFNRENCYIISRFAMSPECVRYVKGKFFLNDSGLSLSENKSSKKLIDINYLNSFLITNQHLIYSLGRGSAQKNLDMNSFPNIKIPLPPMDVQKSIVEECEKVDSEYQSAQKEIENCKNEISAIMENVHNSEFPKKLVSEIASSSEYGTTEKSSETGKVAVLRMGNIQDGKIDWTDLVYSSNEKDIEKLSLKKYDILFNRTNSPEHVGKVGIYMSEQPAIFAGYLIRVNYIPELINPVYLCNILNSKRIREYGFSIMSKSVHQANISGSALMNYTIPVPPLPEQQKIVAQITALEEKIAAAKKTISACPAKKSAILKKWLED